MRTMLKPPRSLFSAWVLLSALAMVAAMAGCAAGKVAPQGGATGYDVVIRNGRVIDPESGLDAVRSVAISKGVIRAVSSTELSGRTVIDARNLVVAPGFIDLHWHGKLPETSRFEAMDGVTTSLELEVGTDDVDRWYAEREGKFSINYGVSAGHIPVRMHLLHDPADFLPSGDGAKKIASAEEVEQMKQRLDHGLRRGALAVGFGVAYTPGAVHWEILEMFRVAARYGAFAHVHLRGASSAAGANADREMGLAEALSASALSGTPLHVAHIQSSGQARTPNLLRMIEEARAKGLDVTTECYPYTAGATRLESFLFDDWESKPESELHKLQWAATGERLTRESFLRLRKIGGVVLIHANTEEMVHYAVVHPLTMIASDGFDIVSGHGHPRSAGTYSRILGRYVRQEKVLTLKQALAKMTLAPAQRLESRAPGMKNKGRIRVGADADITVFDPERIIDKATYESPDRYSEGVRFVLVNGVQVVSDGKFRADALAGRPIRAAIIE
jgi:N-acyl-D-aspartate/D-glutamate deacylase